MVFVSTWLPNRVGKPRKTLARIPEGKLVPAGLAKLQNEI
jgi:hypothetical protein